MLKMILASNNPHKIRELNDLLDPSLFTLQPPTEKIEVEETGKTYYENAFLKAKGYFDQYQSPIIADDSGLNVPIFPKELGIQSARFGGPGLTDRDRTLLLLDRVKKLSPQERQAYYTCVLCFYFSVQEIYFFEGRLDGELVEEWKGEGGFGYDPIFHPLGLPMGVTLAMDDHWKEKNSHRAQAAFKARDFFRQRIAKEDKFI
jgi:XTP/dITP diphosphohydrolase